MTDPRDHEIRITHYLPKSWEGPAELEWECSEPGCDDPHWDEVDQALANRQGYR